MKKLKQSILKMYLKEQYFPLEESTLIKFLKYPLQFFLFMILFGHTA